MKFGLIGPANALPAARFAALAPAKKSSFVLTSRVISGINRRTPRLNAARAPSGCEENMRLAGRKVLGVVAIMAIALHTTLWGVLAAQAVVGIPADPFSVICHSGGAAEKTGDRAPADPSGSPAHACDHCTLCGTAAAPLVPDSAIGVRLLPTRLLQVLTATPAVPANGIAVGSTRARGPPASA